MNQPTGKVSATNSSLHTPSPLSIQLQKLTKYWRLSLQQHRTDHPIPSHQPHSNKPTKKDGITSAQKSYTSIYPPTPHAPAPQSSSPSPPSTCESHHQGARYPVRRAGRNPHQLTFNSVQDKRIIQHPFQSNRLDQTTPS